MSTETPTRLLTVAEFQEMHFDLPAELVRGEVVEMTRPGWRHGAVCGKAAFALMTWVQQARLGHVMTNDTGVITERNPDTLRGPDLFFVAAEKLPKGGVPENVPDIVPNLCVEVLSPHDRWTEILRKVEEYHAAGVGEVWVIDPEDRVVQVFRGDSATVQYRVGSTLISRELPGFAVEVNLLFAGI